MNVGDNYNRPKVSLLLRKGGGRTGTIRVRKSGTQIQKVASLCSNAQMVLKYIAICWENPI